MFVGLKPRMSGSIREQDSGKFASLDAATDTELAERLPRLKSTFERERKDNTGH